MKNRFFRHIRCCRYILIIVVISISLSTINCSNRQNSKQVTTITTASWTATPTEMQLSRDLVTEFEKRHPMIKVKYDVITGDYQTKLLTLMAGGNAPDCFWAGSILIRSLISKQTLTDLTPSITTDQLDISDFYPNLLEPFTVDGKYYGLPNDACTLALFYNKELFEKAGLPYPDENWNWDTFVQGARKLTIDFNKDGVIDQWGIILPRRADFFVGFVYQNGGKAFDEKNPDVPLLTQPAALEALQFYADISMKYHASPSHGQASDLDIAKGFQMGKVAMVISGWWDMVDIDTHNPNLKYGVAPLPKGKRKATILCSTATVMSRTTRHPKETWEFVKFMTGREGQIIRCKSGMAGPSRISVANELYPPEKKKERVFIDGFAYGKSTYGNHIGILLDECGQAYERVLLNQQSVDKAFREACANFEKRKKD